ncbi:MAG: hypothetical protein ACOH2D_10980 [Gelidibacter sp.]|uniref:hypothetical protein n=1 Tax=Gelidibacter sp. TaxID=2018083 RepID=UPI003264D824
MTAVDEHRKGYHGQLSPNIPPIAEILKANNYSTYLSGKWHLRLDNSYKSEVLKPNGSWPFQLGLDQSYA